MPRPISLFTLVVVLLLTTPAVAAVDLEVSLNTTVQGTIGDATEEAVFRFPATAGTVMKIQVSGKGMDLAMTLADGQGNIPITTAPGYSDKGTKIVLKKFVLALTGPYVLRIRSTAPGTYKLKIKGKPAKKAGDTENVAAGGTENLVISAPTGSTVTLKAKAGRSSSAEPRVGLFDGADLTDQGKATTKAHTVKVESVSGGDMELALGNVGTVGGDIVLKVKIKAPRIPATKLDVRSDTLGGGTALSRAVDPAKGGTVTVDDPQSDIDGAGVEVGGGALAVGTVISVSSASELELPDNQQAAGPAVMFGPSGLTFAKPVTIRLPYDPGSLSVGTTVNDLRVLHIRGSGVEETLIPTEVDEVNHELTVEASSFSSFQPFAPKGPPNLSGRQYWLAMVDIELEVDNVGNDSRQRSVTRTTGVLSMGDAGKLESSVTFDESVLSWDHDGMDSGTIGEKTDRDTVDLTWTYGAGNESIELGAPGEDTESFEMGAEGRVLISGDRSGETDPVARLKLLVEKSKTKPSASSFVGDYWIVSFDLEVSGGGGPLELGTQRAFGTIKMKSNGTLADTQTAKFCEFDPAFGQIGCEKDSWNESSTTWEVLGAAAGLYEGGIGVTWTDDDGSRGSLNLMPSADGNIIFGFGGTSMIVLIRKTSGMKLSKIAGEHRVRGLDLDLAVYQGGIGGVGDIEVGTVRGIVDVKSNGGLDLDLDNRWFERDPGESGGVRIETESDTDSVTISVGSAGDFTVKAGGSTAVQGALTADGSFGCFYETPNNPENNVGLIFLLKRP